MNRRQRHEDPQGSVASDTSSNSSSSRDPPVGENYLSSEESSNASSSSSSSLSLVYSATSSSSSLRSSGTKSTGTHNKSVSFAPETFLPSPTSHKKMKKKKKQQQLLTKKNQRRRTVMVELYYHGLKERVGIVQVSLPSSMVMLHPPACRAGDLCRSVKQAFDEQHHHDGSGMDVGLLDHCDASHLRIYHFHPNYNTSDKPQKGSTTKLPHVLRPWDMVPQHSLQHTKKRPLVVVAPLPPHMLLLEWFQNLVIISDDTPRFHQAVADTFANMYERFTDMGSISIAMQDDDDDDDDSRNNHGNNNNNNSDDDDDPASHLILGIQRTSSNSTESGRTTSESLSTASPTGGELSSLDSSDDGSGDARHTTRRRCRLDDPVTATSNNESDRKNPSHDQQQQVGGKRHGPFHAQVPRKNYFDYQGLVSLYNSAAAPQSKKKKKLYKSKFMNRYSTKHPNNNSNSNINNSDDSDNGSSNHNLRKPQAEPIASE